MAPSQSIAQHRQTESNMAYMSAHTGHAEDVLLQMTHCFSLSARQPSTPTGNSATARQSAAGG